MNSEQFNKLQIVNLRQKPDQEELLKLYGLFKQAKFEIIIKKNQECLISRKYKWESWNNIKEWKKNQLKKVIILVNSLIKNIN